MPLEWSEVSKPKKDVSSYTHVIAETPLGQIILEWKGWKEYGDDPCCEMPWGEFVVGYTLDEAKQKVQKSWDEMIPKLNDLCSVK